MNISSVSSSSISSYTAAKAGSNDEITELEKEKAELQKELQKVNQSKDDAKTKQEKVKQIQQQIQQIEAQIQQKKSEQSNQSQSGGQQGTPPPRPNGKEEAKSKPASADGVSGNNIDVQV